MTQPPKACIMGDPVAHSRSPMIHGYWLKTLGLPGSYERERVTAAEFPQFAKSLREKGYVGGNVTVPHKEAAFRAADHIDPSAVAIGAINTFYYEGDRLIGANTDVTGFVANLDWRLPGWRTESGKTLVIGAGGGARGVLYGLTQAGLGDISVANRTRERAETITSPYPSQAQAVSFDAISDLVKEADLIINTTSLGMAGQPPLPLDLKQAKPTARIADIVYVPLDTPLLTQARACNLRTADGLGMLLHQAVHGFEKWFGKKPEVTDGLFDLIATDIRKSQH